MNALNALNEPKSLRTK